MNVNIKTTSLSLTPAISEYVEKRLSSIDKFFVSDTTAQCDIELAKTSNHHKQGDIFRAEVHITAKGMNTYASAEKEDLYAAIDEVRDEVLRLVKSTNEKQRSLVRRGGARIKDIIRGLWSRKNK
jgi:putative sigma-54 modulation protein